MYSCKCDIECVYVNGQDEISMNYNEVNRFTVALKKAY